MFHIRRWRRWSSSYVKHSVTTCGVSVTLTVIALRLRYWALCFRWILSSQLLCIYNIYILKKNIYIHIFERSSTIKLNMNRSAKRNTWLSLRDTSLWQATDSEECNVVWRNRYVVFSTLRLFSSKTNWHHDIARLYHATCGSSLWTIRSSVEIDEAMRRKCGILQCQTDHVATSLFFLLKRFKKSMCWGSLYLEGGTQSPAH